MKVYLAKDWTGVKVFGEEPRLVKCGGIPDIWTGWRLPYNVWAPFVEKEIPRGYLRGEILLMIR